MTDDDDRGPHHRWQTYSRRGNDLMEEMAQKLAADLRAGTVTRLALPDEITARMDALDKLEPAGYQDTEPSWELVDFLNPVLHELGFRRLHYEDF
jgi:hypothetical protein